MAVSLSRLQQRRQNRRSKSSQSPRNHQHGGGHRNGEGHRRSKQRAKQVSYMIGMDIAKSWNRSNRKSTSDALTQRPDRPNQRQGPAQLKSSISRSATHSAVKLQAHAEKVAAELPKKNLDEGNAFLAKNKTVKGVSPPPAACNTRSCVQGSGAETESDRCGQSALQRHLAERRRIRQFLCAQ